MKVLPSFLQRLHESLAGHKCQIIICDNFSQDGVEDFLRNEWPDVFFLSSSRNEGYGAALNKGITASKTPFVALMNPDVTVQPGGFEKLVALLEERPLAAGVSGVVAHLRECPETFSLERVFPNNSIPVHLGYTTLKSRILFYSGLRTKFPLYSALVPWSTVAVRDAIAVSRLNGAFGVYRKEALCEINLFDPRFFLYFEEDDLALRLTKKGYKLYVTNRTLVVHESGTGSSQSNHPITDRILLNSQYMFFAKHYGIVYAWLAFFSIWGVLSIVLFFQTIFRRSSRKNTAFLWQWHFLSLLNRGEVPPGTIPGDGKKNVDYNWVNSNRNN
jgi:GT2 family glycosyltransferase